MNNKRTLCLQRAEDQWDVILISCNNTLKIKNEFKTRFRLSFHQLNEWMTSGKVLYHNLQHSDALNHQQQLNEKNIAVHLKHIGIHYQTAIAHSEIIATLLIDGMSLADYSITEDGCIFQKGLFLLIENSDLATACYRYLLEVEAPFVEQINND